MSIRPSKLALVPSLCLLVLASLPGCVAKSAYDSLSDEHVSLQRERDELAGQLSRLTIERDSLEEQFIEAQESYEDEREVRSTLASNLTRLQKQADDLDADLGAERIAHIEAASALAAREAEIAAMQSTYDELVSDLESEVSSGQIEIERLREGLRLNVSDEVLFASGSAQLDRVGREVLVKVAGQLTGLRDFIEVRGHTDDRRIGGALARRYPTNWELAAARAARVVRLLEEKGVPGDRLAVVSLGPNDPVAPNDSASNRARNRRIEIRLVPREGGGLDAEAQPDLGAEREVEEMPVVAGPGAPSEAPETAASTEAVPAAPAPVSAPAPAAAARVPEDALSAPLETAPEG